MTQPNRKASEYVKVYRFMTEGMGLSGTELLIYARVFGFSKLNGGEFWESKRGIAEFLGISERQAHRSFKSLVEKRILDWHGNSTHDPSQYYDLHRFE